MLKAIKLRLYLDNPQTVYVSKLLGCSRFVYNNLLAYKSEEYKNGNKLTNTQLSKRLTELKKTEEHSFLNEVHSKVLQQSVLNLNAAFSNFFSKKSKYPTFKSRKDKQSCRFPIDAISKNSVHGNLITLTKSLQDIHFKCSRTDEKYLNKHKDKIRSATLTKTKSNKYFLSILIDRPHKVLETNLDTNLTVNEMIGIDLGIKTFATLSTSEVFEAPSLKKLEKQIKVLQQRFSKKQKSSNNKEKSRLKLAKKYEKLTNVRNNFLHSITSKIIRENQTIVLEDLNVSGMMKNHKLARSIQRLSLFEFRRQIEYKAKWYNRNVVFVNRFYPSSKTCSNCGHKKTELKLSERVYNCDNCNVSIDRDLNASFNILNEGKRILGLSSPEVKLVDCLNRNSDVFGELTSDRVKQEKECCSLNFTE